MQLEGIDGETLELIVLFALHQFAPEQDDVVPVTVDRRPGVRLDAAGFFGDELELQPIESTDDGD